MHQLILGPGIAHLFHHAEYLAEVQILLISHNVQALIKMEGILAVEDGRQVAGSVNGGTVALEDQAGRHVVIAQIHHLRAVAFGQQALLLQLVHHTVSLIMVETLTRVIVKLHAQLFVYAAGVLEGDVLEPVKNLQRFGIAVLDLLKPGATLVFQLGVLFGLLMEAHIQGGHRVHAALFHFFFIAPLFVGAYHLAKLRAPVSQMVDGHGMPAQEAIDAAQGIADHGGAEVADMEALGNVDAGIIQHHGFALALIAAAPAFGRGHHLLQGILGKIAAIEEEIEISVHRLRGADVRTVNRRRKLLGNHGRAHAQRLGQLKAGKSKIAQLAVRRNLQQRLIIDAGVHAGVRCPDSLVHNLRNQRLHFHAFIPPQNSTAVIVT